MRGCVEGRLRYEYNAVCQCLSPNSDGVPLFVVQSGKSGCLLVCLAFWL